MENSEVDSKFKVNFNSKIDLKLHQIKELSFKIIITEEIGFKFQWFKKLTLNSYKSTSNSNDLMKWLQITIKSTSNSNKRRNRLQLLLHSVTSRVGTGGNSSPKVNHYQDLFVPIFQTRRGRGWERRGLIYHHYSFTRFSKSFYGNISRSRILKLKHEMIRAEMCIVKPGWRDRY
jgi:hypothetical protein